MDARKLGLPRRKKTEAEKEVYRQAGLKDWQRRKVK